MNLKCKDTFMAIQFEMTKNTVGLKKNDCWLSMSLTLKNEEIKFTNTLEPLTILELNMIVKSIQEMLEGKLNKEKRLAFIKRYLEFKLSPKKEMEVKFFIFDALGKFYKLVFDEEESREFLELSRAFLNTIDMEEING